MPIQVQAAGDAFGGEIGPWLVATPRLDGRCL